MVFYVYILHSKSIDRFYIGASHDVEQRLIKHNSAFYQKNWTAKGIPWGIFLAFPCQDKHQALAIESFIKRMKSKVFIHKLKDDHNIISDLLLRFPPNSKKKRIIRRSMVHPEASGC